jgi:hypothetical protein
MLMGGGPFKRVRCLARAKINLLQNTARLCSRSAVFDVTRRHGKRRRLLEVASMESNEAVPSSGEAQRKVSQ